MPIIGFLFGLLILAVIVSALALLAAPTGGGYGTVLVVLAILFVVGKFSKK
jgi:hypothetical protein